MQQQATVTLIKCTAREWCSYTLTQVIRGYIGVFAFEGMLLLKLPYKQWLCYKVCSAGIFIIA